MYTLNLKVFGRDNGAFITCDRQAVLQAHFEEHVVAWKNAQNMYMRRYREPPIESGLHFSKDAQGKSLGTQLIALQSRCQHGIRHTRGLLGKCP